MSVVVEFAAYVTKCSGIVSSVLLSCLAVASMRPKKDAGVLTRQALSFLVLFFVSLFVYLVI